VNELIRGLYLRKFALVLTACAVLLCAALAHAQQVDVALGAGILLSTTNLTASQAYLPPAEKGGIYPSFSIDRILPNRFGYGAEVAFSYRQQSYNGFQEYRPIFYNVNAIFAPHFTKRIDADFMAGVGGERVLFYSPSGFCFFPSGCGTTLNSNHFLFDLGADIRYSLWRHFFVRPEARFYHIVNNVEFHSDNVLRVGASIGYRFGPK
jgi:hypothetical protein